MRLCLILQLSVFFQLFVGCKASPSGFTWGHYSAKPKQASAVDSKEPLIHNTKGLKKKKGGARRFRDIINEFITGNVRKPSSRSLQHLLYWITSLDAIHSVFLNEYSSLLLYFSSPIPPERTSLVPSVYSKLFYFARLRPRLLYSIGALIRALQLCTPFRRVLDPTVGVGAGINLCAYLAGSRWVKPVVLGWATTKWVWAFLGARQVDRAYLPITLSIHEWEDKKSLKKKSSKVDEGDERS